ncbi:MAG: hypothetical protein IT388_08750, partial [Nitrospirales bacterium]|nr:hypothetical protein [Nitrospirales bacterium]
MNISLRKGETGLPGNGGTIITRTTTHPLIKYLPVVAVLFAWQALSSAGVIPANRLPSPSAILVGLLDLITSGLPPGHTLAGHFGASMKRVLCGVVVSLLIGIPMGLLMGFWRKLGDFLNPFVELIRPVPPLAWVPLA